MTKAKLEVLIAKLAEKGDALAEQIEVYELHPVIRIVLQREEILTTPLWMEIPEVCNSNQTIIKEWNELIGELQAEGLIGPFAEDSDIEFVNEEK